MKLGAFSISLAVKDIHKSKEFYEKLGFVVFGGDIEQNWLILKSDQTVIGLFQGMFENNLMTFNPGWDQDAKSLSDFTNISQLKAKFKEQGIDLISEEEKNCMLVDPDGNTILFDQHI